MLLAQMGEGIGGLIGILLIAWGFAQLALKFRDTSEEKKQAAAKGGMSFIKWWLK